MLIEFEHRDSTSPFIERVWKSRSRSGGAFLSMADSNIELVFTRAAGSRAAILRGPVSRASFVDCPPDGEWLAIRFRVGTYFPHAPTAMLMDHRNCPLALHAQGHFRLSDSVWEMPTFDSAEDLVARLADAGAIAFSDAARAAVDGDMEWMSRRSIQRHFRRATGMTFSSYCQVRRARDAAIMLMDGAPLLDATFEAGYFDQPHFTHSMRRLVGMTPARLLRERPQLSFSYKTDSV